MIKTYHKSWKKIFNRLVMPASKANSSKTKYTFSERDAS